MSYLEYKLLKEWLFWSYEKIYIVLIYCNNMIEFLNNKNVILGIILAIILYFLLFGKNKKNLQFEKEYNEILTSEKYKVKRTYEK